MSEIRAARSIDVDGLVACSAYATNEGAIRFYRRHGFVPRAVSLERET